MKRWLMRLLRLVLACFGLLLFLIAIELVAGWRCNLQGQIPTPVPQPNERLAAVSGIKDYSRPEDDAYLSLPEWYIVWSYQEKADFQKDNLPSRFPYFGEVRQYWGNYCCVNRLTRGKYGWNAGEQVMLVVIGTSFSAEYILKGLYEKTVGRFTEWTGGYQPTEEDSFAYHVARDYADFVHVRPFYEFHFARQVKELWTENHLWGHHLLRKWERKAFLTADYTLEAFYCWLIEKATHLSYGHEPDRTDVWLDQVDESVLSQVSEVRALKPVGSRAYLVEAPRYQPFTNVAVALTQRGARFVEIAGNSSITISVLERQPWSSRDLPADRLFSQPLLTRSGWERTVLRCDVRSLDRVIGALLAEPIVIEHIYDY